MTLKNHRDDLFTVLGVVKKLCEAPKTRVSSWVKNAAARSDHVDLGIYEFTRDIFKKSPRELVDAGVGQDSSPLCQWLYLRENMTRPEWIYGMFLLVCRPEGKPHKIQPHPCQNLIDLWSVAPLTLEGELREVVMDVHTGKRKRTNESLYDFAIRGA